VLFVHLNSNAYASGSDTAHVGYVTNVVNAHPEAKYTVLVFHHAIYSPASHANDGDNKQRRLDFPTAFSNLGVDLVLAGHDHSYSRSYALKNGQKSNTAEQPGAAQIASGPGGVIYVTGNSASGSKYYDLTTPAAGEFGPDPLDPTGKRHYANSVENQEHVRTYVKVAVKNDALVVENLRSGTCAAPNAAVERGNVSWCGPNSGATPAQPVGSVVDKVVIHAAEAPPVSAPVGGTVPATLSLSLGTPATFRPFLPGKADTYTASTNATVVSTAGDAALTASDASSNATGRLVNGTFSLTSPLQVAGQPLPSTVKSYSGPISNDIVPVEFKQSIGANEPLRTGTYAKTLTFTLSTTNP
jgi:hypothetical protein